MIFLENFEDHPNAHLSSDNKLMATLHQNSPQIVKFWKWDEKIQKFEMFNEHVLQSDCVIETIVFSNDKSKFACLLSRKDRRRMWKTSLYVNKFGEDLFTQKTCVATIAISQRRILQTLIPSNNWKQWFCEYSHAEIGELVDAENGDFSSLLNILSIHERELYPIFDSEFLVNNFEGKPIFNFKIIDEEGVLTFFEARKDKELFFLRTLYNTYVCTQLPNGNLVKLFKFPTSKPFVKQIRSDLDDIYINKDLKIEVYNKKVQSLIVSLASNRNISILTFQLVLENVYKQSKTMFLTKQVQTFALELFRIVRKH